MGQNLGKAFVPWHGGWGGCGQGLGEWGFCRIGALEGVYVGWI